MFSLPSSFWATHPNNPTSNLTFNYTTIWIKGAKTHWKCTEKKTKEWNKSEKHCNDCFPRQSSYQFACGFSRPQNAVGKKGAKGKSIENIINKADIDYFINAVRVPFRHRTHPRALHVWCCTCTGESWNCRWNQPIFLCRCIGQGI